MKPNRFTAHKRLPTPMNIDAVCARARICMRLLVLEEMRAMPPSPFQGIPSACRLSIIR